MIALPKNLPSFIKKVKHADYPLRFVGDWLTDNRWAIKCTPDQIDELSEFPEIKKTNQAGGMIPNYLDNFSFYEATQFQQRDLKITVQNKSWQMFLNEKKDAAVFFDAKLVNIFSIGSLYRVEGTKSQAFVFVDSPIKHTTRFLILPMTEDSVDKILADLKDIFIRSMFIFEIEEKK